MKPTANLISNENQGLANSFSHLISLLTNLISTNTPKHQYQLEARDREVCIDLPTINPTINDKKKSSELKHWITDVVKTTISSAFNSFSKNQMSYEQAKIYCSENIFKNIVRLSEKYRLSDKELKLIDDHIKDGVLKYLATKYPQTDSTLANKKLQARVRQIDNIEALDNNYFTKSQIVFEFRQSGNYNDLIMEMLNDLMSMPEKQSGKYGTNYKYFEKQMSSLFQKVEDEEWTKQLNEVQSNNSIYLNSGKNEENTENKEEIKEKDNEEKEIYRAKVKEYTNYLIGRKISEDSPQFTQAEIDNGNIQIKNPQILRILTKWCKELWEKYSNSYFSSRSQSLKLQKGEKINSLQPKMRRQLDQNLAAEKQIVSKTMDQLLKNNYEIQASVLQNELERHGDEHIDEIQKISGKFSHKVVKNLHSCIIIYLNKLIHGLLKAAKKILEYNNLHSVNKQASPLNLLSFKIGDLMRCKCSSKEKEIIRIYEEITRISQKEPNKLKIIRIKNRLRSGTNDILMNVRFNDSVLCEIQLAIKTTASEFIKCSNKFNHYLYELQRSIFGPLTQLGSIWNSLDKRADIYEKLVEQQQKQENKSTILENPACLTQNKKCDLKPYDKSFVCNSCKISYFHNRFIMSHVQCSTCSYILCAKCRIKEKANTNLQELLGNQERLIDGQMVPRDTDLPKFGLCVSIESNKAKVQPFTLITYRDIDYLLSKKESKIHQISRIRSEKEKAKFRNNFLLFKVKSNSNLEPIKYQQALKKYILPLIMKQSYKKQKQTISLMGMSLNNDQCSKVLSADNDYPKQCVKNIFLTANYLTKLPFDPKKFPNVQWITLSRNEMKFIPGIEQINHLKSLYMESCGLNKFPEVFECKELKHLDFSSNNISQIDDRIINLKNLEKIYLSGNQITTIPQSIGNLKELKEINFALNQNLTILPSQFAELHNLQLIDISQTSISKIPCTSGGFAQLKILRIFKTKIKQFPQCFQKSKKIEEASFSNLPGLSLNNLSFQSSKILDIINCGFTEMPSIISNMKTLRTLFLGNNKIKYCKYSFSQLVLLQSLNLQDCNLINFPNLTNCCNLKTMNISVNALTLIPAENIEGLVNLEQFNCQKNKLTVLPTILTKFRKLRKLVANNNQFEALFGRDFQFDGTSCWPKSHCCFPLSPKYIINIHFTTNTLIGSIAYLYQLQFKYCLTKLLNKYFELQHIDKEMNLSTNMQFKQQKHRNINSHVHV